MFTNFEYLRTPKEILFLEDVSLSEFMVLNVVFSLNTISTCFASNDYLVKMCRVSKATLERCLSNLKKLGYIEIEYSNKKRRTISVNGLIEKIPSLKKYFKNKKEKINEPETQNTENSDSLKMRQTENGDFAPQNSERSACTKMEQTDLSVAAPEKGKRLTVNSDDLSMRRGSSQNENINNNINNIYNNNIINNNTNSKKCQEKNTNFSKNNFYNKKSSFNCNYANETYGSRKWQNDVDFKASYDIDLYEAQRFIV